MNNIIERPLMDLEINGTSATLMIDNGVLWDQVWLFGSPLVKGFCRVYADNDREPYCECT